MTTSLVSKTPPGTPLGNMLREWRPLLFGPPGPRPARRGARLSGHPHALGFFSAITSFATSWDVTTQETRIECMHPLDEPTRRYCQALGPALAEAVS
jgi:hypothetical protein